MYQRTFDLYDGKALTEEVRKFCYFSKSFLNCVFEGDAEGICL